MRDRKLDSLDPRFIPFVTVFLSRLVEAVIPVVIVETRRSQEQHDEDVENKRSWVEHSLHQDGLAIDICPFEQYNLHGDDKLNWNADDPIWQEIGVIGKKLGLGWGGDWIQKDMGHFELPVIKGLTV